MIDKKQRANLRVTFLLVCLLPTCLQLWWIVEPTVTRLVSNQKKSEASDRKDDNENKKTVEEKQPQVKIVTETKTEFVEVAKKVDWLQLQGIKADESRSGGHVALQSIDLPDGHWLKKIKFENLFISELGNRVSLLFDYVQLHPAELRWVHENFLNGSMSGMLGNSAEDFDVRISQLVIRDPVKEIEKFVVLSDVRIGFSPTTNGLQAEMKGSVGQGTFRAFRCTTMRSQQPQSNSLDATQLDTNGIPVWLVDESLANQSGKDAVLQGTVSFHSEGESSRLTLKGVVQNVDNSTLTASYTADRKPLANGSCSISIEELVRTNHRITSFRGELQSAGGAISSNIVRLFGNQVKWVANPSTNGVQDFRSFLVLLDYSNDKLSVRSKYPTGRQLVWSEVADILVAN